MNRYSLLFFPEWSRKLFGFTTLPDEQLMVLITIVIGTTHKHCFVILTVYLNHIRLVVEPPLWKMMDFVTWDDYSIPNCFCNIRKFHGSKPPDINLPRPQPVCGFHGFLVPVYGGTHWFCPFPDPRFVRIVRIVGIRGSLGEALIIGGQIFAELFIRELRTVLLRKLRLTVPRYPQLDGLIMENWAHRKKWLRGTPHEKRSPI